MATNPDPSDNKHADAGPILLVGAPRSGTTLLCEMLNRHPRIWLSGETYFHFWVAQRARTFGDLADPCRRARAVDRYLETRRARDLNLNEIALRAHLLETAVSYPAFFRELLRFDARAHGRVREGEKTPHHALVAAELLMWFPQARLIHLVRDPRDVVESLRRMPWGSGSVLTDAKLWHDCVAAVEMLPASLQRLTVHYEALVAQPESELRRVCEFLGEPFTPALLEVERNREHRAAPSRPWFERARGALEKSRVGRWRNELAAADIALIEWQAGPWLTRLGYVATLEPPGALPRFVARAAAAAAALRRSARHLPATLARLVAPDRIAFQERIFDSSNPPVS